MKTTLLYCNTTDNSLLLFTTSTTLAQHPAPNYRRSLQTAQLRAAMLLATMYFSNRLARAVEEDDVVALSICLEKHLDTWEDHEVRAAVNIAVRNNRVGCLSTLLETCHLKLVDHKEYSSGEEDSLLMIPAKNGFVEIAALGIQYGCNTKMDYSTKGGRRSPESTWKNVKQCDCSWMVEQAFYAQMPPLGLCVMLLNAKIFPLCRGCWNQQNQKSPHQLYGRQ